MALLIYGVTGYTGRLILSRCRARGRRPILAGRSEAVGELARSHGLPATVVGLEDPPALERALAGLKVVLHCAGPFSRTSRPIADACVAAGVHYLDITGEIAVFGALATRQGGARGGGVKHMHGAGFGVVPSECLALPL